MAVTHARSPYRGSPSPRPLLDWSVAMPIVVGLVIQLATAVWWGASLNARVGSLEIERQQVSGVSEQLARLDERSQAQSTALTRLISEMDHLTRPAPLPRADDRR